MTTAAAAPAVAARRLRAFYPGLVLVMIGVVIAGFWPSYFGPMARGEVRARPALIEAHALVYLSWMALLLLQVALVYRRRSDLHRKLGRYGMVLGLAVLVMGLVATIVSPLDHLRDGSWPMERAASFLILPIGDMVLFAALFGAAMWYRRRPEVHKRFILMATTALLFAPVARMDFANPAVLLLVWMTPVLAGMGYDLWSRRKVHPSYIVGTALMLAVFTRLFVMESAGWRRVGTAILRAFGA